MKRTIKVTIFASTAATAALWAGTSAFGSSPTPDGSCTAAEVGKTFNYVSPTGLKHDVLTCEAASSGHRWVITSSTTHRAPSTAKSSTGQSSSASSSSGSSSSSNGASSPYGAVSPGSTSNVNPKPPKYVPVQKTPSYKITNGQPHSRLCTRKADPTSATSNGPWWCYLMS